MPSGQQCELASWRCMIGGVNKLEPQEIELIRDFGNASSACDTQHKNITVPATDPSYFLMVHCRFSFVVCHTIGGCPKDPTALVNNSDSPTQHCRVIDTHFLPRRLHSDRRCQGRTEYLVTAPPRPWKSTEGITSDKHATTCSMLLCGRQRQWKKGHIFGCFDGAAGLGGTRASTVARDSWFGDKEWSHQRRGAGNTGRHTAGHTDNHSRQGCAQQSGAATPAGGRASGGVPAHGSWDHLDLTRSCRCVGARQRLDTH